MPSISACRLGTDRDLAMETAVLPQHQGSNCEREEPSPRRQSGRHLKATDKHHNSGWNFISKYFPRRHFAFTALTLICQKSKHKFIGMQQLYSELLKLSRSAKLSSNTESEMLPVNARAALPYGEADLSPIVLSSCSPLDARLLPIDGPRSVPSARRSQIPQVRARRRRHRANAARPQRAADPNRRYRLSRPHACGCKGRGSG